MLLSEEQFPKQNRHSADTPKTSQIRTQIRIFPNWIHSHSGNPRAQPRYLPSTPFVHAQPSYNLQMPAAAPPQVFRPDSRAANSLRSIRITPGFVAMAEGSVLIETGNTRVLCNASIEQGVP